MPPYEVQLSILHDMAPFSAFNSNVFVQTNFFSNSQKRNFGNSHWTNTLEFWNFKWTFTFGPWPEVCQTRKDFSKKLIFKKHLLHKENFESWKLKWKFFWGQIPKWWVKWSLGSYVKKFLLETQAEKMHLKIFLKAYFRGTLGLNQNFGMGCWPYKSENRNSKDTLWTSTFDFVYWNTVSALNSDFCTK